MTPRKTAVYVALSETVGHDLVFRHYTNKVVVGKYPEVKMGKNANQQANKKEQRHSN